MGILLVWCLEFENIVAGNRLRNLGYGIGFNFRFRDIAVRGWNLVRDNIMERMGGIRSCTEPVFYFDICGQSGGSYRSAFSARFGRGRLVCRREIWPKATEVTMPRCRSHTVSWAKMRHGSCPHRTRPA